MKLVILTRPRSKAKIAVLPTGGLMVVENVHEDNKRTVKVYSSGICVDTAETFDKITEELNAQLESWK